MIKNRDTYPKIRESAVSIAAKRFGNGVLLLPIDAPWVLMQEALTEFEPDFQLQREQPPQQLREEWPQ